MTDHALTYVPREQFIPFHERDKRWSAIVAHRRCGKTVACINEAVTRATYTQKTNARYSYIAPFYSQAKDVAWQYLKDYAQPVLSEAPKESELSVRLFNGARIRLYGADNVDALRGTYNDGVIIDEYGDQRPSLWGKVILPTLADRHGWAVFIGTPKGKNHFYDIFKRSQRESNWLSVVLRASETGIIAQEELNELRAQMTEDEYLQEFECSFDAAIVGAFYAALIGRAEAEGRVSDKVAYDPRHKVNVAFDLGYTDSTAMWFWQDRPDGIAVIRADEYNTETLDFYIDYLRNTGYKFEDVWLPHDARAKTLQTGRSTIETLKAAGFPVRITPSLSKQDGINAAKLILPSCHFRQSDTSDGLEALRQHRRKYNEVTKALANDGIHDWTSHYADGFRYMALVCRGRRAGAAAKPSNLRILKVKPRELRLKELFDERESKVLHLKGRIE